MPRTGPTPIGVDNIQRGRLQEVQCHCYKGFGHIAKNCTTRPRLGEQTTTSRVKRRPRNERRHTVTNLETVNSDEGELDYCGHASHTPRPMKILPSYHGYVGGKPPHILVDTRAIENFVARDFLGDQGTKNDAEQTAKIDLAYGTTREAGPIHAELEVELGPYMTTV